MKRQSEMQAPTLEQFNDFKRITLAPGSKALEKFKEGRPEFGWVDPDSNEVELFLSIHLEALNECSRAINGSVVGKWLWAQPTSERAWAAAYRSQKKVAPDEEISAKAARMVADALRSRTMDDVVRVHGLTKRKGGLVVAREAEEMADLLIRENSPSQARWRLEKHIEWIARQDRFSVVRGVADAFEDYFYGFSFFRHAVKPSEVRKRASELLEALAILEDPIRWGALGMEPPKFPAYYRRKTDMLRGMRDCPPVSPIKKLDETAPDRFLAYSLWRVFQRAYRSNRTTAIFNFMQFGGVKNAPDGRSVERWVKEWQKDAKKNRETGGSRM